MTEQKLAEQLTAIRDKFLIPTPDKDFTDYSVITRCIEALSAPPAPSGWRSMDRDTFEAWYCADAGLSGIVVKPADMVSLREGDSYGDHRTALNSKWEAWQGCVSVALQAAPSPDTGKMGGEGFALAQSAIRDADEISGRIHAGGYRANLSDVELLRNHVRKLAKALSAFASKTGEEQPLYTHPSNSSATERMRAFTSAAADALTLADNLLDRAMGTDVPKRWGDAIRRVAEARAALGEA